METVDERRCLTDADTEQAAPHVPPQALAPRLVEIARAFRTKPFVPHNLFRGGHAQTIVASRRLPRYNSLRAQRPNFAARLVDVEPRPPVPITCRWPARRLHPAPPTPRHAH